MGSCISKSKSSKDEEDDPDQPIQIQDKRVIVTSSQRTPPSPLPKCKTPSSPPPPLPPSLQVPKCISSPSPPSLQVPKCISSPSPPPSLQVPKFISSLSPPPSLQVPKCISSPSPPFSTPSTSSFSSFSSTSSCTSSATSKDRSFSNEFLWSCVKDHPHILRDEPKKQSPRGKAAETKSSPTTAPQAPPRRPSLRPSSCSPKRSVPRRRVAPPSPIRVRSNSPPLARQRSTRSVGSSSPSRRFGKENCTQSHLKNNSKVAGAEYQMRTKLIKEANRPHASPSRLLKKETTGRDRKALVDQADLIKKQCGLLHHIHQQSGREGRSEQEIESHPLEDMDNPHIALDCFIFL